MVHELLWLTIKKLKTMEKTGANVFISVSFGKFKKTHFKNMADAISFVREQKLSNTRLRLKLAGSVEEWDNF